MKTLPVAQFIKSIIPPDKRELLRIYEHNFLKSFLKEDFKALRVNKRGDYWCVDDGQYSILIPKIQRWRQYRFGLEHRFQNVADKYGLGRYYEICPKDLVIDIGANIGEFSIIAHKRGAVVYAIEADNFIFGALKKNTEGSANIFLLCEIIWNKNEIVTFYSSARGADSSVIKPDYFTHSYKAEAVTLDCLMRNKNIHRVKLIKCDSEGAEPEVLHGAEKILRKTEWVAFDCSPERHGESTFEYTRKFLISNGYTICSDNEIKDVRGMRVIAKNDRLEE